MTAGVAAAGIPGSSTPFATRQKAFGTAAFTGAVILGCWILTKSRSAWLATLVGVLLLGLGALRQGRRTLRVWHVVMGASLGGVAVAFGVLAGALDRLVITEALKSFSYRIEYWRASWAMIADHRWFGCGPGNFQQCYTRYKLPGASETVTDPHNFLLEIWASGGTPAAVLFLAVLVAFVWQLSRCRRRCRLPPCPPLLATRSSRPPRRRPGQPPAGLLGSIGRAAAGLFSGGLPGGSGPRPGLLDVRRSGSGGHVSALARLGPERPLTDLGDRGGYRHAAAEPDGGGRYQLPGRRGHPLAVGSSRPESGRIRPAAPGRRTRVDGRLDRPGGRTAAVLPADDVRSGATWLGAGGAGTGATQPGRFQEGEQTLQAAAAIDPWSEQPWQPLPAMRHRQWLRTGSQADLAATRRRPKSCSTLNPRSSHAWTQQAEWLLAGYLKTADKQHLEASRRAAERAVELCPNDAMAHAQLALLCHLAGDSVAAARQASVALQLDAGMPHQEQKLVRRRIFELPAGLAPWSGDSEQLLRNLRTAKDTEKPDSSRSPR